MKQTYVVILLFLFGPLLVPCCLLDVGLRKISASAMATLLHYTHLLLLLVELLPLGAQQLANLAYRVRQLTQLE